MPKNRHYRVYSINTITIFPVICKFLPCFLYFCDKDVCKSQKPLYLIKRFQKRFELIASVAQSVEQLTLNQLVDGSNPPGGTILKPA